VGRCGAVFKPVLILYYHCPLRNPDARNRKRSLNVELKFAMASVAGNFRFPMNMMAFGTDLAFAYCKMGTPSLVLLFASAC
jgi:hypothetical protein